MNFPQKNSNQLRIDALNTVTAILQEVRCGDYSTARQSIEQLEANLDILGTEFAEKQRQILSKVKNLYSLEPAYTGPDAVSQPAAEPATPFALTKMDVGAPQPGISLVTACMNREQNLLSVLDSWLETDADEIVIVDWSSNRELKLLLAAYSDPRIKIIRIDNEKHWILTHAFNVGLRFASRSLVVKLDCDIRLTPEFLENTLLHKGEFARGFWRTGLEIGGAGQQYINGSFVVFKEDLRAVNYFNERIVSYGWDDSDLYCRLTHDHGLAARQIDPNLIRHIDQIEGQRLENQQVILSKFMGLFEATEFEGAKNKFYSTMIGGWGPYSLTQDYLLSQHDTRFYRGYRTTSSYERDSGIEKLAEVLASSQLSIWGKKILSDCGLPFVDVNLGLSMLLSKAHRQKRSAQLINAVQKRQGIQLIRCEDAICHEALQKTIAVFKSHYPVFADSIVILENATTDLEADWIDSSQEVLFADKDTFVALVKATDAQAITDIGSFAESLASGSCACHLLTISVSNLAFEIIAKIEQIQTNLSGVFEVSNTFIPKTAMITSLFDEGNLLRLVEYIACVVANIQVFERIAICYESSSGLLSAIVNEIAEILNIAPGHILFLPHRKRPIFEELFSVGKLLPEGTVVAVANADIAFDASFAKISALDLTTTIAVLSRKDISKDGKRAHLIRLSNGYPNTFSADAWIFSVPFTADFFLDYAIGSFHCDSFINNQISRSEHYSVVNPCLDVNAFHLHDERFNSSAEKHRRDTEIIQKNYGIECERNGGVDPVKGVLWSTARTAHLMSKQSHLQRWSPKGVCIQLGQCGEINFGHFLLLHAFNKHVMHSSSPINDVSLQIQLSVTDIKGVLGTLLSRYLTYFSYANVTLDVFDSYDIDYAKMEKTLVRQANFTDLANGFMQENLTLVYELLAWPTESEVELLRCEIGGEFSTQQSLALLNNTIIKETLLPEIIGFYNSLQPYSPEKMLIAPFVVPCIEQTDATQTAMSNNLSRSPQVTFVTSLFRGGSYLKGYLENVLAAAIQADGEVIIIDVNPDNHDQQVITQFIDANPDACERFEYLHLDHDPGLYACWQLAISKARADLITNANIDDRRSPFHTARLVNLLTQNPHISGACGSISCIRSHGEAGWFSLDANELWFYGEGTKEIDFEDLYRFDEKGEVLSRNVMHCMPVWRKSLHERYGAFDEEVYGTSADWAFWLKCAKAGERFMLDENAFGRYFLNPDSHNRRNDSLGLKEQRIIKDFLGFEQSIITKQ
jgi:glycosyltransferase involved in cell wall biosynthesis